MGGNRPMTLRRGLSLVAVVGVLLGAATGVSHIGHSTTAACQDYWRVVVGHASDRASTATQNVRANQFAPTTCSGSARDPKGGFFAFAYFTRQADAQAYLQQLDAAGFTKARGYEPYLMQTPPKSGT